MIFGAPLFTALGVLAGAAMLTCRTLGLRQTGETTASRAFQTAANLCFALSGLFALAVFGALWLNRQEPQAALDMHQAPAWGALWIYVFALVAEWRQTGLRHAVQRAAGGLLAAVIGMLFLGVGLEVWASRAAPAGCANGVLTIDMTAPTLAALAGFGLALVPMSGVALWRADPGSPPLSAAAASVVMAAWLQPVLPALGWLPVGLGNGAALALLLITTLTCFGVTASRRSGLAGLSLLIYLVLSAAGSMLLATL